MSSSWPEWLEAVAVLLFGLLLNRSAALLNRRLSRAIFGVTYSENLVRLQARFVLTLAAVVAALVALKAAGVL